MENNTGKGLIIVTEQAASKGHKTKAYALFLRGRGNVMEELHYMQELDMPSNFEMVVSKLPYKLREWKPWSLK